MHSDSICFDDLKIESPIWLGICITYLMRMYTMCHNLRIIYIVMSCGRLKYVLIFMITLIFMRLLLLLGRSLCPNGMHIVGWWCYTP